MAQLNEYKFPVKEEQCANHGTSCCKSSFQSKRVRCQITHVYSKQKASCDGYRFDGRIGEYYVKSQFWGSSYAEIGTAIREWIRGSNETEAIRFRKDHMIDQKYGRCGVVLAITNVDDPLQSMTLIFNCYPK